MKDRIGRLLVLTPSLSALFKLAFLITVLSTKPPIMKMSSKVFEMITLTYGIDSFFSIWTQVVDIFILELIHF